MSLTLIEACGLIESHLHQIPVSSEEKGLLLLAIDFVEKNSLRNSSSSFQTLDIKSKKLNFYWPWEWNWFGLNKHQNKNVKLPPQNRCVKNVEVELPGNCYVGACEAFAGALLCIIPHPITWSTGVALITDGGRRMFEGMIQISEERRLDPEYRRPDPQF